MTHFDTRFSGLRGKSANRQTGFYDELTHTFIWNRFPRFAMVLCEWNYPCLVEAGIGWTLFLGRFVLKWHLSRSTPKGGALFWIKQPKLSFVNGLLEFQSWLPSTIKLEVSMLLTFIWYLRVLFTNLTSTTTVIVNDRKRCLHKGWQHLFSKRTLATFPRRSTQNVFIW